MIELLVIVGLAAAFLVASDRKDRRHQEQVQKLLQRIQAPEQAVLEHAAQERPEGPLYRTEFDDDMDHLNAVLEAQ